MAKKLSVERKGQKYLVDASPITCTMRFIYHAIFGSPQSDLMSLVIT